MNRINFNIKDRKFLITTLSLAIVCIFTLTIAYSALSAVLTISGNARVSAADWDIYLNNPRVTNGSATTNVPEIKTSSTLEFETTLNMPGDFYEFVVDVVNGGDIDAMIENVVKTPDLTEEQAKFLKYEITYQNGESITNKQLLAKDTTMPIKVRIEYRKDLVASDLPTGQVVLDLSLTLEYIQSDGSGSSVKDNGVQVASANGDINEIGTIVTIGTEQFYTIGTDDDNVKLFAMYNLYVGGYFPTGSEVYSYGDRATGMQDSTMLGWNTIYGKPYQGVTPFSSEKQKGTNYSDYSGSIVEEYVNNYQIKLENNFGVDVSEARLITKEELIDQNTFACSDIDKSCSNTPYNWIISTSYWTGTPNSSTCIWMVSDYIDFNCLNYDSKVSGVRPVIVISKDYFN